MNMRTITFNELRKIKDSLPSGSMHRIADELGPDGGLVMIDDTTVLERALKILDEMAGKTEEAVRA